MDKFISFNLLLALVSASASELQCIEVPPLKATKEVNAKLEPGQCLIAPDRNVAAVMQHDGNFVVYPINKLGNLGKFIFDTGTYNKPGSHLELQNDGNIVVYTPEGTALWESCTVQSEFGSFFLQIQGDNNLVAYAGSDMSSPTRVVWSSIHGPFCSKKKDGCTWKWKPDKSNVLAFVCN